jgi:hypothetical protein
VDQQTIEARAYGLARRFKPLLLNSVVGFIGPEYLFDGKQIIRAGLEDHFCGKLLGLPMGCDICYTNHAEADEDDMDITIMEPPGCSRYVCRTRMVPKLSFLVFLLCRHRFLVGIVFRNIGPSARRNRMLSISLVPMIVAWTRIMILG